MVSNSRRPRMSTLPALFRKVADLLALFGIFFSASVLLSAQSTNSSLSGVVKDSSGAVVSNAELTLTAKTTGAEEHLNTGGDGIYRFSNLQAGSYTLQVSAAGFNLFHQDGVVIALNESATLDVKLT